MDKYSVFTLVEKQHFYGVGLNPGPLNLQASPLTTGPQVVDKIMQASSFKPNVDAHDIDHQSKFVSRTLLPEISTMMRFLPGC